MNSKENKKQIGQKSPNAANSRPVERQDIPRRTKTEQKKRPPTQPRPEQKRPTNGNPQKQVAPRSKKPSELSDNLRSQTPLQRQMRKQTAPSEPGTVRRTTTQRFKIRQEGDKPIKRPRKKTNRSFTKQVILLGVIGYLILLPITILIASLLLKANIMTDTDDYRYQLGEGRNTLSRKVYSYSRVYRDGVYYIDMDSLADYCKLTTTGNEKNMRYVVRESAESVEFVIGESIAYINEVPERTGGNAFVYGGKVHIPLEFAKRCFLNLDITLDIERSRITITRHVDENGNYLPLDFPYKLTAETDKIIFGALEVDIQEQIIAQNQPVIPEVEGENNTTNNN